MIYVSTYGSGALISRKGLVDCVNTVSDRAPVPFFADPIGYLAAKLGWRSDVRFVKSGARFGEHGMDCKTYREAVRREAKYFMENYTC